MSAPTSFGPWTPAIYYQYYHDPFDFAEAALGEAHDSLAGIRAGWNAEDPATCLDELSYAICNLVNCRNALLFPEEFRQAWDAGHEADVPEEWS